MMGGKSSKAGSVRKLRKLSMLGEACEFDRWRDLISVSSIHPFIHSSIRECTSSVFQSFSFDTVLDMSSPAST
eukprot:scaffold64315_cov16-Tisochrysis_lutea.AAC.1